MNATFTESPMVITDDTTDLYEKLRLARPSTLTYLQNYVKVFLGISPPARRICPEHSAPMDYLWHAYNSDFAGGKKSVISGDCMVWANRGGGKTELAAAATLLDCIFKPGCAVRILAGSLDQSSRMYEYFTEFVHRDYEHLLKGAVRKEKCMFINGSTVEILPHSPKSIRGRHIHKLRCDEVELFDEHIFSAAKFITKSSKGILASMEMISTMHRPYGLMQKLISQARLDNTPVFKWCVWETIERCIDRSCSRCPLNSDCAGKARQADGYLKIDDCITQMRRSSRAGFQTEMLCLAPSLDNAVFADFNPAVHVAAVEYDPNMALYRAIDFGFVNPFVCLFIQADDDGNVRIIDEYIRARAPIDVHAEQVKTRTPGGEQAVAGTFCDPAGAGVNDVTGTSTVKELRSLGINVRYRKSTILEGVELVRRALRTGDGQNRLVISHRCTRLIEAMRCYHYPERHNWPASAELPVKDGVYDHPIDALRYFFVNYTAPGNSAARRY